MKENKMRDDDEEKEKWGKKGNRFQGKKQEKDFTSLAHAGTTLYSLYIFTTIYL